MFNISCISQMTKCFTYPVFHRWPNVLHILYFTDDHKLCFTDDRMFYISCISMMTICLTYPVFHRWANVLHILYFNDDRMFYISCISMMTECFTYPVFQWWPYVIISCISEMTIYRSRTSGVESVVWYSSSSSSVFLRSLTVML